MVPMNELIYEVPVERVPAHRGKRLIVRAREPAALVTALAAEEPEHIVGARLLSLAADSEPMNAWAPGLPVDLVMADPAAEFPLSVSAHRTARQPSSAGSHPGAARIRQSGQGGGFAAFRGVAGAGPARTGADRGIGRGYGVLSAPADRCPACRILSQRAAGFLPRRSCALVGGAGRRSAISAFTSPTTARNYCPDDWRASRPRSRPMPISANG